ncbi:MAG: hypothetical protein IPM56_10695 [Ignavibacteriales bacterium]|nr:MAG: hypothetical protein IPM56_10695 [Ignavibacteriales bacterium]
MPISRTLILLFVIAVMQLNVIAHKITFDDQQKHRDYIFNVLNSQETGNIAITQTQTSKVNELIRLRSLEIIDFDIWDVNFNSNEYFKILTSPEFSVNPILIVIGKTTPRSPPQFFSI